jgi:hypothetical protein
MKRTISCLFEDPRKAEGTVRELALMQIAPEDVTSTPVRGGERRSFIDVTADETPVEARIVHARVDLEDVPRVEATLARNGGVVVSSDGRFGQPDRATAG